MATAPTTSADTLLAWAKTYVRTAKLRDLPNPLRGLDMPKVIRLLEEGELDVMVGGLTSKTPWAKKVATTRPYLTTEEDGKKVKHVMATVRGENALLSTLERYLDEEVDG